MQTIKMERPNGAQNPNGQEFKPGNVDPKQNGFRQVWKKIGFFCEKKRFFLKDFSKKMDLSKKMDSDI